MGFSFHNKKHERDSERHLRRIHKTVPIIESPLEGADVEHLVFSQRHEANTVELFFDLFFVANLATFTAYHSITDTSYLFAYVGFFGILWSAWFQVTLHDVRFSRDSIYERVSKTIQFIVFVGLALVGSAFKPGSKSGDLKNFRILCYTLVISRGYLALQYCIVLFFSIKKKANKIYFPLGLMIAIYAIAAAIFGAMTPAFRENRAMQYRHIYLVWYVVMLIEGIAVIAISCCWRMLSFKKTHLMERMSLLTLIVIGEGAIGVTKTVGRIMGKSGLDVEGCFLIMCIILVLVLIWALYFDNFPHGHYGTIRQQIWSLLHFPFQLAIVGVVEGSQQIATARYVLKTYRSTADKLIDYCINQNLDGSKLRDKLLDLVDYFQLTKKLETYWLEDIALHEVWIIGNHTGICDASLTDGYNSGDTWPQEFYNLTTTLFTGVYTGLGMKIPITKLEQMPAEEIALKSFKTVYMYYWVCMASLILCSVIFLILIRRHKADAFDFVSIIFRVIVVGICIVFLSLIANTEILFKYIASPWVLPTVLFLFLLVLAFDRLSAVWSNSSTRKRGKPYAQEVTDEHHGHEGGHGHEAGHGALEEIRNPEEFGWTTGRESKVTSMVTAESVPLAANTAYQGGVHGHAGHPMMSPPLQSPPVNTGYAPGGYMPVSGGQHYGA